MPDFCQITTNNYDRVMKEWLAELPEDVQAVAREFPIGTPLLESSGEVLFVMGYNENKPDDPVGGGEVWLIVSETQLSEDYDKAWVTREYICPDHFCTPGDDNA